MVVHESLRGAKNPSQNKNFKWNGSRATFSMFPRKFSSKTFGNNYFYNNLPTFSIPRNLSSISRT